MVEWASIIVPRSRQNKEHIEEPLPNNIVEMFTKDFSKGLQQVSLNLKKDTFQSLHSQFRC